MRRALLLAATATLLACATSRRAPAPGDAGLTFPPDAPRTSALDAELAGKNDEELFAIGTAAASAGDDPRTAAAFGALADRHPRSPHVDRRSSAPAPRSRARTSGGSRSSGSARSRRAAGRRRSRPVPRGRGALPPRRSRGGARRARRDPGAPGATAGRARALAQRGVVELDDGRADAAEATLREALRAHEEASATERLAPVRGAGPLLPGRSAARRSSPRRSIPRAPTRAPSPPSSSGSPSCSSPPRRSTSPRSGSATNAGRSPRGTGSASSTTDCARRCSRRRSRRASTRSRPTATAPSSVARSACSPRRR